MKEKVLFFHAVIVTAISLSLVTFTLSVRPFVTQSQKLLNLFTASFQRTMKFAWNWTQQGVKKCPTHRWILIKKNQLDALISQIYFWNKTLHVSDNSSVHHQEFFTVHICHTGLLTACNWMQWFLKLIFWNKTLHVSDNSSVHHETFCTVHTAMVYVIKVSWQLASRIRTELQFRPDPTRKLCI